jgi:hypothetical protein
MMQSLSAPASSLSLSQTSSDNLFGVSNRPSYAQTSQTADSETKIQSGILLQCGTSGKALKCYFNWFMARVFTGQSLFLNIKLSWNYKPSEFCQQGFSAKLWENRDLIHQPLVIDIFVQGEFLHPVYIVFQTVCLE